MAKDDSLTRKLTPELVEYYLSGVGNVKDKRVKYIHMVDHALPVVVSGGKGGYYSAIIDVILTIYSKKFHHLEFVETY